MAVTSINTTTETRTYNAFNQLTGVTRPDMMSAYVYRGDDALERMAPDTPQVSAELQARGTERVIAAGHTPGTIEFNRSVASHIQPRGVPPMAITTVKFGE